MTHYCDDILVIIFPYSTKDDLTFCLFSRMFNRCTQSFSFFSGGGGGGGGLGLQRNGFDSTYVTVHHTCGSSLPVLPYSTKYDGTRGVK